MMIYPDTLKKAPTKETPWIQLEPGKLFIMGRSIPENPGDFYRPVLEWISKYSVGADDKIKIDIGFEYINSSSTKWIYNILKELSELKGLDHRARVTWFYEHGDEDMCELGFILRPLVDCPFILTEVKEMNKAVYEKIISGTR
jgi:hypothetical protein